LPPAPSCRRVGQQESPLCGGFPCAFGLVVYFALQSELLQLQRPIEDKAFYFFTLFAFVAGSSERLTHVILGGAERTVAATLEEADKAVGEKTTTAVTPKTS